MCPSILLLNLCLLVHTCPCNRSGLTRLPCPLKKDISAQGISRATPLVPCVTRRTRRCCGALEPFNISSRFSRASQLSYWRHATGSCISEDCLDDISETNALIEDHWDAFLIGITLLIEHINEGCDLWRPSVAVFFHCLFLGYSFLDTCSVREYTIFFADKFLHIIFFLMLDGL